MTLYAVVPAAGVGKRMGADRPKQYLQVNGQSILEHTLTRLLCFPTFEKIMIAVNHDDPFFHNMPVSKDDRIQNCDGGKERVDSVLNGLNALLQQGADVSDWVMVHDVARPCISQNDIQLLYDARNNQGAIIGAPVRDTMKRTDAQGNIIETVEREQLWHALTPQLSQIGILKDAIEWSLQKQLPVTDEASALEHTGLKPKMIAGLASNIKVTHPDDLAMVTQFLTNES